MLIEYLNEELRLLAEDSTYRTKRFHPNLVRAYRKKLDIIITAPNEQSLRSFKSLRLEKLQGDRDGQYSIRLDSQFRMILRFKRVEPHKVAVLIEIVDYH